MTAPLITGSGAVASSYRYDPYRRPVINSSMPLNPFRYTSSYQDSSINMYQMGAGYYWQYAGRFTQLNPPPESMMSINRYAYVSATATI